jgi:hypothetical protein
VLDPSLRVDVSQTLSEACALLGTAAEESSAMPEVEEHVAVDAVAMSEEERMRELSSRGGASRSDETPGDHEVPYDERSGSMLVRRRSVIFRSAASAPRLEIEGGAMVPRASFAVLHRALVRAGARKAQRQPKLARARSDRSVELREGLDRPVSRTPRWLVIGAADLPQRVPPPPARHRPHTMLEL